MDYFLVKLYMIEQEQPQLYPKCLNTCELNVLYKLAGISTASFTSKDPDNLTVRSEDSSLNKSFLNC